MNQKCVRDLKQEVAVSEIVDTIIKAQDLVRRAEAGAIEWDKIGEALLDHEMCGPEDLYQYVADVYFRFRLTEAVAYHYRGDRSTIGVKAQTERCARERRDIEEVLTNSESFVPTTPAEEVAKLWVEEKLRWALGRLDAFREWGY